jgi:adenosylcobinamide kinase / adenosylcobinamide-phosphate guanylyltransferase
MARVILITGGSRSGKSAFAQTVAESLPGPRVFIATCPVLDEEMRTRIRKHREARAGRGWETVEEQADLAAALASASHARVILVDCLTLWINNLLYRAEQSGHLVTEDDVTQHCRAVLAACANRPGTVIFVTNEVGSGIVPENALARRFRDLAGRCNQQFGVAADVVALVTCGVPLLLKGELPKAAASQT